VVPAVKILAEPDPVGGDPESSDGIPDAEEFYTHIRPAETVFEGRSFPPVRLPFLLPVNVIRLLHKCFFWGPRNSALPHEPDQASRSIGSAAESEYIQLISSAVLGGKPVV